MRKTYIMAEKTSVIMREPTREELYNKRNFWCFALGSLGRDAAYGLFSAYLLSFIMFTKTLTPGQFSAVSIIIIAARVFDAFNDPIMGGIVNNTRSKFGKFRPWVFIGGLTTSLIIVLVFSIGVDNWGFIAFLAVMYLCFSVSFTMNDISYWALLPHLARGTHDRNKLTAVAQLVASAGGALPGILVPALTTQFSALLGGSARSAYMWLSLICAVMFIGSTMLTVIGVKDHTEVTKAERLALKGTKNDKLSIKDMFLVLKNNDQLLISAIVMIIFCVGVDVTCGTLVTTYVYFAFGYNGLLTTIISVIGGALTVAFLAFSPMLQKKFGRTKVINFGGFCIIGGFLLFLLVGLFVPNTLLFSVLGMDITLKFLLIIPVYGVALLGKGCFYNLMFLNMSNTVEYNEWKTGRRDESLIFSLRPFTAKFSSALQQLLVTVVYLSIGVLDVTNGISEIDKQASTGAITNEEMLSQVGDLLNSVPEKKVIALLCCMCLIPIVFMIGGMILYKKKFILDDETFEKIKKEIADRNLSEAIVETDSPEN